MRLFVLMLVFSCQFVFGQQLSLEKYITKVAATYNIVFSYNASLIANYTISNTSFSDITEAINYIEFETDLSIEKVDAKNYLIIAPKKGLTIVCGKVLDKNKQPLVSMGVFTANQHTFTNSEGYFYLEKLKSDRLVSIKGLGYKTKIIPINLFEENCKTIFVEEQIVLLDEVVIENYLTNGISKKENGSIAINLKETGTLPGVIEPDAIQTLQFIPGLQSPDETVTGIHIRGSTPDQNLVLFDGVKMYQDAHFFGLLSVFNPYVTNNIQLYRSATKAAFGGHAGGVISIDLDNQLPKNISAGIGTTLTHANADVKIPVFKDRLAVFASVRRGISDFTKTITFEKYTDVAFQNTSILDSFNKASEKITDSNSQFLYEDYFAKVVFQPYQNLKFDFGLFKNKNSLSFKGLNPFVKNNTIDNLGVESETLYEGVSFNHNKLGNHSIRLSNTTFGKKYKGLNNFDISTQPPTVVEITFDKENSIEETSFQYQGSKKLFNEASVNFGYQRNRSDVFYTADNYGKELKTYQEFFRGSETSQSFYTDFLIKKEKFQFNLGVRRQYFNRFHKVFWEPRAFVNYKLLPKLWLKTSYELKNQSISQITDLRNDGLGPLFKRLWVISTEESVPIIKNEQFTLGIDFQKKGWTLDIEAYSKNLNGIGILITDDIENPRNVSGINTIKGIDFLLKKQWKYYGTWLSYSFSDQNYKFKEINNNRPFKGTYDIPHSLVWAHTLNFKEFSFSLGYKYRTGIPYTQKQLDINRGKSNFITFEKFNGKRLPDYYRLDATIDYKFYLDKAKKVKTRLGLTLQNITNKKNILSRDYRTIESTIISEEGQTSRPVLREINRVSLGFTPNFIVRFSI